MTDNVVPTSSKTNVVYDQLDSVERLVQEKRKLIETNKKEIIQRDQTIKDLEVEVENLQEKNKRLTMRLEEMESRIKSQMNLGKKGLQSRVLELQQVISSFNRRVQMLIKSDQEHPDKEQISLKEHTKENKAQSAITTIRPLTTRIQVSVTNIHEANATETVLFELETRWSQIHHSLKLKGQEVFKLTEDNRLLGQQYRSAQQNQCKLRNQCNSVQNILKENQDSRVRILQQIRIKTETACKNAKVDIARMSKDELKRDIGLIFTRVQTQGQEIVRLQQELYECKEQSLRNMQKMTSTMSKLKQQKEKEFLELRSLKPSSQHNQP